MHEGLTPFNYEAWLVMGKPLDKIRITFRDKKKSLIITSVEQYHVGIYKYVRVKFGTSDLLFPEDNTTAWEHKLWLTN
jgi:hypothetical protein